MNIPYKDRLIHKAHERINRLKKERMEMPPKSPQWKAKTSQINKEKDYIKNLRENSNRENINEQSNGKTLDSRFL
jgi:hypothetical protein